MSEATRTTNNRDDCTYTIVFDGGALGNPGKGYGSFKIFAAEQVVAHQRHEYGDRITNNQAEYRTLIAALDELAAMTGEDAAGVRLRIFSDSLLVVSQLAGRWRVKNEGLRPLYQEALTKLRHFGTADLQWHDRSNSVAMLGH